MFSNIFTLLMQALKVDFSLMSDISFFKCLCWEFGDESEQCIPIGIVF